MQALPTAPPFTPPDLLRQTRYPARSVAPGIASKRGQGFLFCLCLFALIVSQRPAQAESQITITLSSDAEAIEADGHSQANISVQAYVNQTHYTGPLQVSLRSSLGDLDPSNLMLNNGIGFTHLRAGAATGTAYVTLQLIGQRLPVILPGPLAVVFLPPGTRLSSVASQRFLSARADSLAYSVDYQRIVAVQHARVSFQKVTVTADSITVDTGSMELRAESLSLTPVTAKAIGRTIAARKLYLNFQAKVGYALTSTPDGGISASRFTLDQFQLQPQTKPLAPQTFSPDDIEGSALVIRAHSLSLYPGTELHCTGASIFVSGKHVFSLPYYRLVLNPYSPNAEQYVSYDTYSGLGIDIPFYYMLKDNGMGSLRITHQERTGFFGTDAQGGWSLGIKQDYGPLVAGAGPNLSSGGTLTLDRLTSQDWGFSWRHNQHFGQSGLMTGYFYSPDHRGITGDFTMYMPTHGLGLSLTTFGNHQSTLDNLNSLFAIDLPQQTLLHRRLDFNFSTSLGFQYQQQQGVNGARVSSSSVIPGATANIYAAPWTLDRFTSLMPSLSTRYFLPSTGGYLSANAGMTLARQIGTSGSVGLTYTWSASGSSGSQAGYSHQVMSADFYKQFGYKLRFTTGPSYDITARSLYADALLAYSISPRWTLDAENQLTTGNSFEFNDWQVGLSRAILGRNVRLFYDANTRKLRVELTGGQLGF